MNAPAPVVHWELQGPDVDLLRHFYRDLFDWTMREMGMSPAKDDYVMAFSEDGDHGIGGGFCKPTTDRANLATFYIQVPDVAGSLEAVRSAGGTVVSEVTEVPGVITFAMFADPAGNVVGLVHPHIAPPRA